MFMNFGNMKLSKEIMSKIKKLMNPPAKSINAPIAFITSFLQSLMNS